MPVLSSPFSLVFVVNELVIVSIERRFSRSPTKSRVSFVVSERKKSVERSMRERIGKGSSYFAASPRFNSVRFQCSLFCYQAEKSKSKCRRPFGRADSSERFSPFKYAITVSTQTFEMMLETFEQTRKADCVQQQQRTFQVSSASSSRSLSPVQSNSA